MSGTAAAEQIQSMFGLTAHETRQVVILRDRIYSTWTHDRLAELAERLANDSRPVIAAIVYEALRTGSVVDRLGALAREPPGLWKELFSE